MSFAEQSQLLISRSQGVFPTTQRMGDGAVHPQDMAAAGGRSKFKSKCQFVGYESLLDHAHPGSWGKAFLLPENLRVG